VASSQTIKQQQTWEKWRKAGTMKSGLARKWNPNNNEDYEDNDVIDGLRTQIRQKL
jgi:hypothetical protein